MFDIDKSRCQLQVHAKDLDPTAEEQVHQIVNHPALHGLIAIMPDAHAGAGCVIGFTGKFSNAVIPNIVGVDIGCGVACHPLPGINKIDFPSLDKHIRNNIPLGMNRHDNTAHFDRTEVPDSFRRTITSLCEHIEEGFYKGNRIGKHIQPINQIGTLGGGNHFIEIGQDEQGGYHLIIHSGSRNLGKRVAEFYQNKAVDIMKEMRMKVPRGLELSLIHI